jgi:hypothetical protein
VVAINQIKPVPATVMLPVPKASLRVFELLLENIFVVRVKLLRLSVPCVSVTDLGVLVSASPKVTVMPEPFTVTLLKVLPDVVIVPVPVRVMLPVWLYVIAETSVTLPATVIAAVPVRVPANPVQLMLRAPVLPVAIVQVPVEAASKNTSSAVVGTEAPPAPPDVAAHLVPAVPSQLAVPPTQ